MNLRLCNISALLLSAAALTSALCTEQPTSAIRAAVLDAKYQLIAKGAVQQDKTVLSLDREYQRGDSIRLNGPKLMVVQLDEKLPECMVFSPLGMASFVVPFANERKIYPTDVFGQGKHTITARPALQTDLGKYRNLALNPYDIEGPAKFYPHASSSSASRRLPEFSARNAIDGSTRNTGHGTWPMQSWSPGTLPNPWWKLDFGREVEIDKLVLYIRADFPHDDYWKAAEVEFSDGTSEPLAIKKIADPQVFSFSKRKVLWLKLTNFVQDTPSGWFALSEVEAWGKDAKTAED